MLTQHTVEDAAAAAGFSGWVRCVPSTGSTNTDALRLGAEGAPPWSLVVAGHQEAGRGRLGRAWVDRPGASLLLSFLLRPSAPPSEAPLLPLAAGMAMVRAIHLSSGVDARCKWPNDLLAGGRKLGGILSEAEVRGERLRQVVVGIGVNASQTPDEFPPEVRASATSVANEGGRSDLERLLRASLTELRWMANPDDPAFRARVLESYPPICDTIGRTVAATTTTGERVEGTASGIGDRGQLLVRTDGELVEVAFGEVEHLR